MAEGIAKKISSGNVLAFSAGSKPSGRVNPDAIDVMKEIGIDISDHASKGFRELPVKEFDYVVTMGCQDVCPFVPAKEHIDWQIDDPKGRDKDFFRKVRDEIRQKVQDLICNASL
jgi:protein-tyrosine-phosphatase